MNYERINSVCECESKDETEQIRCFIVKYVQFLTLRDEPVTQKQLGELYKAKRLSEINLGQFVYSSTNDELAASLILQSFLDDYYETHPSFARQAPPTNFAPKIDFFKNI